LPPIKHKPHLCNVAEAASNRGPANLFNATPLPDLIDSCSVVKVLDESGVCRAKRLVVTLVDRDPPVPARRVTADLKGQRQPTPHPVSNTLMQGERIVSA